MYWCYLSLHIQFWEFSLGKLSAARSKAEEQSMRQVQLDNIMRYAVRKIKMTTSLIEKYAQEMLQKIH